MEGGAAGAMGGGGAAEAGQGAPLQPAPFFYALPHRRDGNEPGPRCGHTLTPLNVADGAPPRLVLFGGATALESGSSQATPGGNGIRLAGATSDVHMFDVRSGTWTRLQPSGEPPSPRAAHAAAAVGSMIVIQGGIGPSGLADADLHVLDLSNGAAPRWVCVPVTGAGPASRYAHSMALVAQRFLLVLGGNDGRSTLGDVWALDTASKPYAWKKVEPEGEGPNARMYSAVASRFDGLLLLCGGRDASGASRADAYGLARHRDGRWEWAAAPGVAPAPRYQHTVVFVGHRLVVCGGAAGGGRVVEEAAAVVMDTSAGGWAGQAVAAGDPLALACRRCRHAAASVGSLIFLHGGLRGGTLLEDMVVADDAAGPEHMRARQLAAAVGLEHEAWQAWATDAGLIALAGSDGLSAAARSEAGSVNQRGLRRQDSGSLLYDAEEGAAVARILSHAGSSGSLGVGAAGGGAHEVSMADMSGAGGADGVSLSLNGGYQTPARARTPELGGRHPGPAFRQGGGMAGGPPSSGYRDGFDAGGPGSTPGVRIHHKVVVVESESNLVRQLSLDQFDYENRRIMLSPDDGSGGAGGGALGLPGGAGEGGAGMQHAYHGSPSIMLDRSMSMKGVHKLVLRELLRPREWAPPLNRAFFLQPHQIMELCRSAEERFQAESSVLRLRAPVKIFGDLHGQFGDLMRLFNEYGTPSLVGDINYIDYLFLGDYVDRGMHSLETITLLLALKIEYPHSVHLIRGNHEASLYAPGGGFAHKCSL